MLIPLNISEFRINFPVYANETAYPDSLLSAQYEIGKCFVADNDCTMPESCREYALQLMLSHLLNIRGRVNGGAATGIVTSASEGAVSVSLSEPPTTSTWGYWLSSSPYGMELLSMLSVQAVGGMYVGGSPERRGFRKINGGF